MRRCRSPPKLKRPSQRLPKSQKRCAREVAKADAEAFISKCASRKFETAANSNNGGKLRRARIMLCAKPGESDEQWIATLEKAASSVVASTELSIEAKAKISGDLQREIARLRASE